MKKILSIILTLVLSLSFFGCSNNNNKENNESVTTESSGKNPYKQKNQEIPMREAEVIGGQNLVLGMPNLDYVSDEILILHSYFGIFIHSFKENKMIRTIDLRPLECALFDGDKETILKVSNDGKTIQFSSKSMRETEKTMYVYDLNTDKLTLVDYKEMENPYITTPIREWNENADNKYSSESIKLANGEYGYLFCKDGRLANVAYMVGDETNYIFEYLMEDYIPEN